MICYCFFIFLLMLILLLLLILTLLLLLLLMRLMLLLMYQKEEACTSSFQYYSSSPYFSSYSCWASTAFKNATLASSTARNANAIDWSTYSNSSSIYFVFFLLFPYIIPPKFIWLLYIIALWINYELIKYLHIQKLR